MRVGRNVFCFVFRHFHSMGAAGSLLLEQAANLGFDPGNAAHVVAVSLPGAVVYGTTNAFLEASLYRKLGFAGAGVPDTPDAPAVLGVKFQQWFSALVAHSVMWGMWSKWAVQGNHVGWLLDLPNWTSHCFPKIEASAAAERRSVGPYYVMYFSYVLHSCYKDMIKSAGRKGGSMQVLFDLHHIVAVGLTALSINWGGWRAGVLTRLIHDIGDIVLYASKLQQAMYESGASSNANIRKWFIVSLITWFVTRIGLYGWACIALSGVMKRVLQEFKDKLPAWPYWLQIIGCWIMFALQVAFCYGMTDAARGFWKTGGVVDPLHGTTAHKAPLR